MRLRLGFLLIVNWCATPLFDIRSMTVIDWRSSTIANLPFQKCARWQVSVRWSYSVLALNDHLFNDSNARYQSFYCYWYFVNRHELRPMMLWKRKSYKVHLFCLFCEEVELKWSFTTTKQEERDLMLMMKMMKVTTKWTKKKKLDFTKKVENDNDRQLKFKFPYV